MTAKSHRNLLTIQDLSHNEIEDLFDLTQELKRTKGQVEDQLRGKSVGLLFQKPSNRTRVSFEVGIWQMGGNCVYLSPEEINLGKRESTSDVAKTLSRYLDCIVARTNSHDDIIILGQEATIPIINGLSDLFHPCQALTDIFTIKEKFKKLQNITIAYVGDGNNVCHSLLLVCARMGLHMNVATPKGGYEPNKEVLHIAKSFAKSSGSRIHLTTSPVEAVKGAQVIYSDVWVSMGQEKEKKERLKRFKGYQINAELLKEADSDYIFMHCLPAHRGEEVTAEIIDGPHSVVFDQAENRLHVQKAVLIELLQNQ